MHHNRKKSQCKRRIKMIYHFKKLKTMARKHYKHKSLIPLGEELKKIREKKGLTIHNDIVNICPINKATVQAIETGSSVSTYKLAVYIDWLTDGKAKLKLEV